RTAGLGSGARSLKSTTERGVIGRVTKNRSAKLAIRRTFCRNSSASRSDTLNPFTPRRPLMQRSLYFRPRFLLRELLGMLVAAAAVGPFDALRPAAAKPLAAPPAIPLRADALPAELQYVPPDAAFFVHADAAAIWNHEVTKSFR